MKTTTAIAPQGATDIAYLYDEWELIAEYTLANGAPTLHTTYTWGQDHLGNPGGDTRPGSILSVTRHQTQITAHFFPTYDGSGNVSEYLDANGAVAAHFEYDPYGNVVASSGDIEAFPIRHATKPVDRETGFHYYGLRYYDPLSGRWTSRDPIGETGGRNLSAFVGNDPVNFSDLLGMKRFGQDDWKWGYCLCQFLSGLKYAGVEAFGGLVESLTWEGIKQAYHGLVGVVEQIKAKTITLEQVAQAVSPGIYGAIQHMNLAHPNNYSEEHTCWHLGHAGFEVLVVAASAAGGGALAMKITSKIKEIRRAKGKHGGPGDVAPTPDTPAPSVGHPEAPGNIKFKRWKRGEAIDKPMPDGSNPSWDVVRERYWKNRYEASKGTREFDAENMARMRRGSAPQDYNPKTGQMESRELHHVDPQRNGGSNGPLNLREVTPDQHRALDPYRR